MTHVEARAQVARNIRLLVEYDGSRYVGWQWQKNGPSIQAALMAALAELTREEPVLYVAGRTDAGVHAVGQVTNFVTQSRLPTRRFAPALNNFLPDDISVHRSEEVPLAFNARHDSTSKRYRYRVYQGPQPSALENTHSWYIKKLLALEPMREAAALLIGEHDFDAFRSAHCDASHARRRMYSIEVTSTARPPVGSHVDITFHANAYCRHMCRIISGTLVDVGRGVLSVGDVRAARDRGDRSLAGVTAPPGGLTLLEVLYG